MSILKSTAERAFLLALSLIAAGAVLPGCLSESKLKTPAPAHQEGGNSIQEINLLAIPVALNFDEKPGPDGFVIKIFASNRKRPRPLLIASGKIEVLMFDGLPGITENASFEPKRTWTYSAEELKSFRIEASIGTGYQIAPLWGDAKPTCNKISVLVRYTAGSGATLTSAPSVIAVSTK